MDTRPSHAAGASSPDARRDGAARVKNILTFPFETGTSLSRNKLAEIMLTPIGRANAGPGIAYLMIVDLCVIGCDVQVQNLRPEPADPR